MFLLTRNTPRGITTITECSAMPTPRQLMVNSHCTIFSKDSTCVDRIPILFSDLPKPNLLHSIHVGMLDHLQKWIFHFMNTHGWLNN
jgi:hypothetical protein